MLSIAYFEIQADNPQQAMEFYRQLFGWEFFREPQSPPDYWQIRTDNLRGGLLRRPAPIPPPPTGTNAFVCSVEVPNFDALAEMVLKLGGNIALPKFAIPGKCWQGYFLDPEGNTFGAFQVDPNAA